VAIFQRTTDGPEEQIFGGDEQVRSWGSERLRSEKAAPMHSLGSNEATYGLREGGAGFHRNRPAAGKAKPNFQQASFSEFEMLMGLDDEVLKRYPSPR
jgi:hypothetical protein